MVFTPSTCDAQYPPEQDIIRPQMVWCGVHIGSAQIEDRGLLMDQKLLLRQQMREEMDDEIVQRTRIHQAKVARLKVAAQSRKAVGAPAPSVPLVMLAHGDSWFDYPLDGNGISLPHTDIIAQLEFLGNINPCVLNISQWGDATTAEMSWPKQQKNDYCAPRQIKLAGNGQA
jgi:hypothetical protein